MKNVPPFICIIFGTLLGVSLGHITHVYIRSMPKQSVVFCSVLVCVLICLLVPVCVRKMHLRRLLSLLSDTSIHPKMYSAKYIQRYGISHSIELFRHMYTKKDTTSDNDTNFVRSLYCAPNAPVDCSYRDSLSGWHGPLWHVSKFDMYCANKRFTSMHCMDRANLMSVLEVCVDQLPSVVRLGALPYPTYASCSPTENKQYVAVVGMCEGELHVLIRHISGRLLLVHRPGPSTKTDNFLRPILSRVSLLQNLGAL